MVVLVVTGVPFAGHRLQIPNDLVRPTEGWGCPDSPHTLATSEWGLMSNKMRVFGFNHFLSHVASLGNRQVSPTYS